MPIIATPEHLEKLRHLPAHLRENIRGQDHVIEPVCSVLRRGELGLANPRRPRGSFLFVGPTGVGKTEIANVFTSYLFAYAKPLRFDMSEYQNQSSVEKLIGAHPDDVGLLGRALARADRGTLLFDEVEKAHPLVLDLFLQILDDAAITLATGERKNLSGFYAVFTSNIGAAEAMRMQSAPFASIERTVLARVGQELRPELVGRMRQAEESARLAEAKRQAMAERRLRTAHEMSKKWHRANELRTFRDACRARFTVVGGDAGAAPQEQAWMDWLDHMIANTDPLLSGAVCQAVEELAAESTSATPESERP